MDIYTFSDIVNIYIRKRRTDTHLTSPSLSMSFLFGRRDKSSTGKNLKYFETECETIRRSISNIEARSIQILTDEEERTGNGYTSALILAMTDSMLKMDNSHRITCGHVAESKNSYDLLGHEKISSMSSRDLALHFFDRAKDSVKKGEKEKEEE